MYRIIFLACFISACQAVCQTQTSSWPWAQSANSNTLSRLQSTASEIAEAFTAVDQRIQRFCQDNANHYMDEIYGMDNYRLSTTSPIDFSEDSITVKIMHRIIFVSAQSCSSGVFGAVRLLPDVVEPKKGVWKYSQGKLIIVFPYKMSQSSTCGQVDQSVYSLPRENGNCAFCGNSGVDSYFGSSQSSNVWHHEVNLAPRLGHPGARSGGGFGDGGFHKLGSNDEEVF